MYDRHYMILPSGALEEVTGSIPADCPLEEIVLPRVSNNLVLQAKYENLRLEGVTHAWAVMRLGWDHSHVLFPLLPQDDSKLPRFEDVKFEDRHCVSDDIRIQALYSAIRRHSGANHEQAKEWVTMNMILAGADFSDFLDERNANALRQLMRIGPVGLLHRTEPWGGDTARERLDRGEVIQYRRARIFPVVSKKCLIQRRYREMRAAGESHKMAEVLACRAFPGVKSDAIFNEGKFSGESNQGCHQKELWLRKEAEKAGFSTNGKWYCSGLADYPGDPDGWVGGRGDVEAVARRKNLNVDGYVMHKGHETAPRPDLAIDPKLVENETLDIMDAYPGSRYGDVYENVYNLRTGKVDNNPLHVSEPTEDWG